MNEQHGWYFTAPWDPVWVRRADALGFGACANYFGSLLAPGLSNNTFDARWITLLSWCLKWSHVVWRNAGGGDLSQLENQRARYAWLRPLELLWIARTFESGQMTMQITGQLPGRRSIERWRQTGVKHPDFGMSPDRFRRYRQAGVYGAYRVVFRTISGLTTGDGWTPGEVAFKLAQLVNDNLPRDARLQERQFETGTKWSLWKGEETRYWMERGWTSWRTIGGWLPTPKDAARKQLPDEERRLLGQAIFGGDCVRRATAKVLASAKGATHADLCDALASSVALVKKIQPASLAPLPAFSRLADSAMDAMRELWAGINHDEMKQSPAIEKLARLEELQWKLSLLRKSARGWLSEPSKKDLRSKDEYVVTSLAQAMYGASTPVKQIMALARHHQQYGGGQRWFQEQGGKLIPLVPDSGIAASNYGFRLQALCRLAAQCGIASMNHALDIFDSSRQEIDAEEGDAL